MTEQIQTVKETYAFGFIKEKQKKVTEESGTISMALAKNIASRKVPQLFTNVEAITNIQDRQRLQALQAVDEARLVDRGGKATYLTRRQTKIVYALSMFLNQQKDKPEVESYVKSISRGVQPITRIAIPVSITELTKMVTTDGKARSRQKAEVLSDLKAISEMKQVQTFGIYGTEEGSARFIASLINISEQLEDLSKERVQDLDYVTVQFGSIFFYQLYNKYAIIKPSLFQIWGKAGSGTDTELFGILLSDLLEKYSGHKIAWRKAKAKKGTQGQAYYASLAKAQKEALTYSEYASSIKERTTTDYTSQRVYKATFWKHLEKAIEALIQYGLIKEAIVTKTPKGERIDFVFNENYTQQDETELLLEHEEPNTPEEQ